MIKIKGSPEQAEILSEQLRHGFGHYLSQRRAIIGLSLLAAGSMGMIGLYQTGIIPHLPEPPIPGLNSDKVDASAEAYQKLEMPDSILGIGNYAITAGLAAMGGMYRAERQPWIPLAMTAKIGFDTYQAARLYLDQTTKQKALCGYCILAAVTTIASIPLAIPETVAAISALIKK
ncbi:MAG TPA: vitamin K epoxide reductase family protein [Ktedonobacteraceae bacterium]|jgi:uncharacterized membrane protein|nr:vitamin K epoxide reductase family protein [Ktedonobacteraceae bacterium]